MIECVFDYLCDDIGLDEQSGLAGQETDPITILLIYETTFIVLVNTATSSSLFNNGWVNKGRPHVIFVKLAYCSDHLLKPWLSPLSHLGNEGLKFFLKGP